jgi:DNA-binding PadR family transcriptional regulator
MTRTGHSEQDKAIRDAVLHILASGDRRGRHIQEDLDAMPGVLAATTHDQLWRVLVDLTDEGLIVDNPDLPHQAFDYRMASLYRITPTGRSAVTPPAPAAEPDSRPR